MVYRPQAADDFVLFGAVGNALHAATPAPCAVAQAAELAAPQVVNQTVKEVLAAWAMSGDMDYMLHVVAADFDAYADFALKALLRMPGVKETRSSFVLTALKPLAAVPV